jgi:penicillin amidase
MRRSLAALAVAVCLVVSVRAEEVTLAGLQKPVEILRDRWGVPHIYAQTVDDLFFAQGYVAARDRLFQIDLWRRIGTGSLSEILGPSAISRDTLARRVRFRGNWNAEWQSYGPDTKKITTAFTKGINAYIKSLGGKRPLEFRIAGYDPGLWQPEDCLARVAGLLMTRNLTKEVDRVRDVEKFGLAAVEKYMPPDPFIRLRIPNGLDLKDITERILQVYRETIGRVEVPHEQGSNNWVVDGTMTTTGKPMLANDPHRPVVIPSLRKTVHLVAPGWNAFGSGEPALPGIALGHNENIAWGFTIVGIDQVDLYVERLNPQNPDEYLYRGNWRKVDVERESLKVKGRTKPEIIELRYTMHGPIIHEDRKRNRAYALRWVGSEPGTAGYLAGLAVAQAKNWNQFLEAMARWKVPSENIVYADTAGNMGWQAAGLAPIRKNWSGLFPVPGHTGEYEWSGFRRVDELPHAYNPPAHFIATANHNILPPGYTIPLGYEWSLPFRFQRIHEVLSKGGKFSIPDFERLQQDVTSVPARRFQAILKKWTPRPGSPAEKLVKEMREWDASMTVDSRPALIYEVWISKLPAAVFGPGLGSNVNLDMLLKTLETDPHPKALQQSLEETLRFLAGRLGPDEKQWRWGRLHQIFFRHVLDSPKFNRGPVSRPGDANTVNATSGADFKQTNGASYRELFDLSDWDRSVMTNVPGESGNPDSPHYDDLIKPWAEGKYHPMPFTRKAVEATTIERITLIPQTGSA